MEDSLPQLTRSLASKMQNLSHVEEVKDHDGSVGSVTFAVADDESLSGGRLSGLLPDSHNARLVVTSDAFTTVYVERDR